MNQTNGWSEDCRQRPREAIHRWKPWERATGPRTAAGKAIVALNGRRGPRWLERQLTQVLREQLSALEVLVGRSWQA